MKVILFRHGEAEEQGPYQDDSSRNLTPRGRKRSRKMVRLLSKLVASERCVQLWTSPLTRAVQTAEFFAERMGIEAQQLSCLANGDFSALQEQLDSCLPEDCVIIVGHEPYLSGWMEDWLGFTLPLYKSAAVGMTYILPPKGDEAEENREEHPELLWYIQPGLLKKTPVSRGFIR